ncbi:restriction endonuclease [Bacillus sporothermodurans]|uniref:type II restriction endonuclease n=1 Tax=Heyndrickxia sporothermodurans TaxID=46224 RepID=UPI00192A8F49|nr:type II restriction endonuclease [Heyndrickxia sporothermodurans]MBL5808813.1 restriction endonuclease [Heyndrickxia sporothermodurans]MBL5858740.1 restriction endonuclease [Heyndrickxia sporothermodurans]MBL5871683.1 restriction endonuclease [Heyndrickxia sporothermodurans]
MQQNESEKLTNAIEAAKSIGRFYCKFISANDVDLTGAHQVGLYIAKQAWNIFFEEKGVKGENKDKYIKVHLDGYYPYESRVIYYGRGTRNEYRITRFWTNSPFEKAEQVGNLIIFMPMDQENFKVYILDTEDEIEKFIDSFSLSLMDNNAVYNGGKVKDIDLSKKLEKEIEEVVYVFEDFPETIKLAELARQIHYHVYKKKSFPPDTMILEWVKTEYSVFRAIERNLYKNNLSYDDIDPLIAFASSALNRRKSRAGKSLEHYVDFLFSSYRIPFSHPGRSEGNKKPDFLLPSNAAYADKSFLDSDLIFLGAKTTCKDRWRQILNEANRIDEKHLLTLQQGISPNQLDEMADEKVTLVVPKPYHSLYPAKYQNRLWTVEKFIHYAEEKYSL